MLEAADRRGRSSAAHVRSCSGLERRGERSARALRVLYGLRLLEMAALERFWCGLTANSGGIWAASG